MFTSKPNDAVVVGYCRTPIGKIQGALAFSRPDDLLALVFEQVVLKAKIPKDAVEEAYAGCANQAGEDNRNVARMALLIAGFPYEVPAVTVNRLCASGLEAVLQASRSIWLLERQVVLAGGVESMSRAPWAMAKPEKGFFVGAPRVYDTSLGWRFENPKLQQRFPLESMGETAENLAHQYEIGRDNQDAFALLSHQKAVLAQEQGFFKEEMVSMDVCSAKGAVQQISQDECPRKETSKAALAKLKPAFKKDGSVTAGNSAPLNDGAAAVLLTSREYAKAHGLPILSVIRAGASTGVHPSKMGIGPVPATKRVLQQTNLQVSDLDAIELNEAFAAQALAVIQELGLCEEKTNMHGGAIALGHPLGCSGARLVVSLTHILNRYHLNMGLASLCVGVGQGLSAVVSRE